MAHDRKAEQRIGPHIRFNNRVWVHPYGRIAVRPGGWTRLNLADRRGDPLKTEVEIHWGTKPGTLSVYESGRRQPTYEYEDLGLIVPPATEKEVLEVLGASAKSLATSLARATAETLKSEGYGAKEARGFSAALAEDVNFHSLARVLGSAREPETKADYSKIAVMLDYGIFEAAYFGIALAKEFRDTGTMREIMAHWVEEYSAMKREEQEEKFHMRGASVSRVADAYEKEAWGYRMPVMPRSFHLPKELKDAPPNVDPQGTDAAIWTWEDTVTRPGRTRYMSLAFAGKSNKPIWYESHWSEAERQQRVDGLIRNLKRRDSDKAERLQQRRDFKHDIKVGDIYYTSWGYDQTNVNFYEVVAIGEKSVFVREVAAETVDEDRNITHVVAKPGAYVGSPTRVVPGPNGFKVDGHYASKWGGEPVYETASGWGH